jgi:hypothetical protein
MWQLFKVADVLNILLAATLIYIGLTAFYYKGIVLKSKSTEGKIYSGVWAYCLGALHLALGVYVLLHPVG